MSRYLGPLWKKSRALGYSLLRNKKEFSKGKKRTTPPGMHGDKRKRKKSAWGTQLQEKQKVMFSYGWRDKQMKNEYIKAEAKAGNTGVNLLISSESRLDNLIFKSGLLNTIDFAREWVSHGHFLVNGKKVKTPSYKVEPGQTISLKKEKMRENKLVKGVLEQNIKTSPYLNFDRQKLTIKYVRYPTPEELDPEINLSLVVEYI